LRGLRRLSLGTGIFRIRGYQLLVVSKKWNTTKGFHQSMVAWKGGREAKKASRAAINVPKNTKIWL